MYIYISRSACTYNYFLFLYCDSPLSFQSWLRTRATFSRCIPENEKKTKKRGWGAYTLNTRNEEKNTVFHSYLACFVHTRTLNMCVSMSYTGSTRWYTWFIFLWLCHRNLWIYIQHVGWGVGGFNPRYKYIYIYIYTFIYIHLYL